MLNYFVRNLSYFQTIRNNRDLNTGYIYDDEFSKIENYINNKILPTVDNLRFNKIAGVLNSDGYLLRNIGNKVTKFDRFKPSDIKEKIIDFDRLRRITPNSIVYCQNDNLISIPYVALNTTLSNVANNCLFQKITSDNIQNKTISASKVALGVLTRNHLDPVLLNYVIVAIIDTIKIADQAINEFKIANKAITQVKLNDVTDGLRDNLHLGFVRQGVTGLFDDAHIIKARHIPDNSVDFKVLFGNNKVLTNACIPLNVISVLANNTINPYRVFGAGNLLTNAYIKDKSFNMRPVPPNIYAYAINKSKLSHAILAKLAKGGLV